MYTAIVRAARRCVVDSSSGIGGDIRCQLLSRTRWSLPCRAHGTEQADWQGITRLRVRLCGRPCTAVCIVRRVDARQMHAAVDSGCDENVQLMCERSNYGLCWLQRKSWHRGDARVMDLLLGLLHCWRWSSEPYIRVCPSVGRNLGELSAGDLPQPDFGPISMGVRPGTYSHARP